MRRFLLTTAAACIVALPAYAGSKPSASASADNAGKTEANASSNKRSEASQGIFSISTADGVGLALHSKTNIDAKATARTVNNDGKHTGAHVLVEGRAAAYYDKDHNPVAVSSADVTAHARIGKKSVAVEPNEVSARAVGGKEPMAAASARYGKEHTTAVAYAGGKIAKASGGTTVITHPKPGETVAISYTKHTEAVGISYENQAQAYAQIAARGQVFTAKTVYAAAYAAAVAFAQAWQSGAYAYAGATGIAGAQWGSSSSHARVDIGVEAVIYENGVQIAIKPPPQIYKFDAALTSTCVLKHVSTDKLWHLACSLPGRGIVSAPLMDKDYQAALGIERKTLGIK